MEAVLDRVVYIEVDATKFTTMLTTMKEDTPNTPYNILWFTSDMQRFDTIHCLNNPHIHTPNLDRLCADGVAFTHTYCQNVICIPSRSSFLTGRYPSSIRACMSGISQSAKA